MSFTLKQICNRISTAPDYDSLGKLLRLRTDVILDSTPADSWWPTLGQNNSEVIDEAIKRLYQLALAQSGESEDTIDGLAIIATGGYGRGELAPFSDVDVTFITIREDDDRLNPIIKALYQSLMDVFLYGSHIKVGYAYRLMTDVVQLDHQTQTALLDARLIVGNPQISEHFIEQFRKTLLTADFIFQKAAERESVLTKSTKEPVPFVVEPNVKEGSGGLRDAQMVEWLCGVLCGVEREQALEAAVDREIISRDQLQTYEANYQYLKSVRNAIHCSTRDSKDILTTEKQELVASFLGYQDDNTRPGVEIFMSEFYEKAFSMKSIADNVTSRCLDSDLELGIGGLRSRYRKISIADIDTAQKDSVLPLHACEMAQAYNLGYASSVREQFAHFFQRYPEPPRFDLCGRVLSRILSAPRGVSSAVRWLVDSGVIDWAIPEFKGLRNLIPYDAVHDYTVGEHSVRVVEFLDRLQTTNETRFAEFKRIWEGVENKDVLFLAGLIHDIGKQSKADEGHSENGADIAEKVGTRFGWSAENTALLVFLVRHHLLMAETSRLRDTQLEETIRDFIKYVDEPRKLYMLILLTCADTNMVGEGVWTEMQARFLGDLFARAEQALSVQAAGNETVDGEAGAKPFVPDLAKHRDRIRKQLQQQNLPVDAIHDHTAHMPAQYLLNTGLEDMYMHMAMINRLRSAAVPTVDFRSEFGTDFTELTIVAYDDASPGLLAKIFGVLYALDVSIHASQVFTRESSVKIALDTLWVDFRGKPLSSPKKSEVQEVIRGVLTGRESLNELFDKRKKPIKEQGVHSATIDNVTSERYTFLEIQAPQELGVLYRVTQAISDLRWDIHSARLSLWGSRVRAAFYVTTALGAKLDEGSSDQLNRVLKREESKSRQTRPIIPSKH